MSITMIITLGAVGLFSLGYVLVQFLKVLGPPKWLERFMFGFDYPYGKDFAKDCRK